MSLLARLPLQRLARGVGPVVLIVLVAAGCADDGDASTERTAGQSQSTAPAPTTSGQRTGTQPPLTDAGLPDTTPAEASNTTLSEEPAGTKVSPSEPTSQIQSATTTVAAESVEATDQNEASDESPNLDVGPTVAADLATPAAFGTGVTASIVHVEPVEVEGHVPGDRSGPGVLITIEVDNDSTDPISLDYVTVDLIRRDGASAVPVSTDVPNEFSGELPPGASATGAYQYFIPVDQRESATITVNYASGVPTALFSGDLPDA